MRAVVTTLIVGWCRFGRRVGLRLAELGETVFGTTRHESNAGKLAALGIKAVVADVLIQPRWRVCPRSIACFTASGPTAAAGVPMRTAYVDGVRNSLEAAGRQDLAGGFYASRDERLRPERRRLGHGRLAH